SRSSQHSKMFGQPASSQTVCRPSRRTSDLSAVYSGPVRSRVLIHSGFFSIGTAALRTSRRNILRSPGSIAVMTSRVRRTTRGRDAAAPVDLSGRYAERGADLDQRPLEPADVGDDVDGVGERDDRVPGELARSVPRDPPAAVDVDDGCAIGWSFPLFGALAGG